jgi:hypothetical protein
MIGRGLLNAMAGSGGNTQIGNGTATVSVTIFSGVLPAAATISSNWTGYNTAYLAHWQGVQYNQPLYDIPGSGVMLTMANSPADVVAYNNGTAAWGIIWTTDITPITLQGLVLPNSNFIVGNVSLGSGSGIIRMANLSVVLGTNTALLDSSITAS